MTTRLASNHDLILAYGRSEDATWNGDTLFQEYDAANLDAKTANKYSPRDESGRRYQLTSLTTAWSLGKLSATEAEPALRHALETPRSHGSRHMPIRPIPNHDHTHDADERT